MVFTKSVHMLVHVIYSSSTYYPFNTPPSSDDHTVVTHCLSLWFSSKFLRLQLVHFEVAWYENLVEPPLKQWITLSNTVGGIHPTTGPSQGVYITVLEAVPYPLECLSQPVFHSFVEGWDSIKEPFRIYVQSVPHSYFRADTLYRLFQKKTSIISVRTGQYLRSIRRVSHHPLLCALPFHQMKRALVMVRDPDPSKNPCLTVLPPWYYVKVCIW